MRRWPAAARKHLDALVVALVVAGLWGASYAQNAHTQAVQQRQGAQIERALCSDLATMGAIPPPAGPAATNPSRAYDQAEHRTWAGLARGLHCKETP